VALSALEHLKERQYCSLQP